MWPGLKQSGRLGSTSDQAMSMAPGLRTYTTASMARMGPPSTTTWVPRTPSLRPSPTQLATQETMYQAWSLPCNPQNSSPSMWPATQVCVTAKMGKRWAPELLRFYLLHLLITATGRGRCSKVSQGSLRGQLCMPKLDPNNSLW